MRHFLIFLLFCGLSISLVRSQNIGFNHNVVCLGNFTTLWDTSGYPDTSIASLLWDIDNDGQYGERDGDTVKYLFEVSGDSIPVGLKIIFNSGPPVSVVHFIKVAPLPQVDFNVNNQCANKDAVFEDNSFISNGEITQWIWDFDNDGSPDKFDDTVTNDNGPAGNYTINLECVSNKGCRGFTTKTLEVFNNPSAGFSYQDTTVGAFTLFSDASSIVDDSISLYQWDFGDGFTSTLISPSHSYDISGTYTVRLITISDHFCRDTASSELTIIEGSDVQEEDSLQVSNNIVTPNGDGINDGLKIANLDQYTNCSLLVFNRWNDMVYSGSAEPEEGTFNGLDAGVYYYILQCNEKEIMGSFNMLK